MLLFHPHINVCSLRSHAFIPLVDTSILGGGHEGWEPVGTQPATFIFYTNFLFIFYTSYTVTQV